MLELFEDDEEEIIEPIPLAADDNPFLTILEPELLKIIGPIAPLIIEEEIETLGGGTNPVSMKMAAALVSNLGKLITDEAKREVFQEKASKLASSIGLPAD